MEFKPAQRKRAKLRLAIAGPSGSGKTYSSLVVASGIAPWSKVAVIDSENGSAELYAHLGGYSVLTIEAPYDPQKYINAIHIAEQSGFEVIIIDSLSHAWNGEGGILDQQGRAADTRRAADTKYKGNSWAAWRECTPKHNSLVEAMLKSSCHIIATMRSKTEYAQVTENGKTAIKKLGLAPIQRDGMEYEFTAVFDINLEHVVSISKDRTGLFDGHYFKPDVITGRKLLTWLNCDNGSSTATVTVTPVSQPKQEEIPDAFAVNTTELSNVYRIVSSEAKTKGNGQVFAKVVLLQSGKNILVWSSSPDILDVPVGTLITVTITELKGTHVIESYAIVKAGAAA